MRAMPRELPREVFVLSAVAFSVAVGFGIVAPILAVFAREFGVGRTAARSVEPHQRGRANGMFGAGFLIGGVAGPFFGGVLGDISLRIPFFVYAGTLAVAGTIAMLYLSHTHLDEAVTEDGVPQRTTFAAALRHPAYRAALVTNVGTGWTLFGVRSSLIPLFVVEGLARGPIWIGVGFLVGSVAQALSLWPAGRIADNVGRKPAMVGGGLIAVVGVGLLAVSETLVSFLVSMALYGLAAALLGVAPAAVVGDVVEGRGGTVVAAFQMAGDLGAISGPLVAGFLADQESYAAAFAATAAILGLGTVMSLRMPETVQRPGREQRDPAPPPSPG